MYVGSFCYADDVILLSTSISGLKEKPYVKFNLSKTILIVSKKSGDLCDANDDKLIVKFQDHIEVVNHDVHIANSWLFCWKCNP